MADPSRRMLALLSLLQGGRAWPAAALAARLDTSPRSLRRDLDRLRELGYPVTSVRGPGGHYRLAAGRALPPLQLSDEHAVAIVVGLRIAATRLGGVAEATAGALAILEPVLPARLRPRVRALTAAVDAPVRTGHPVDLRMIETLAMAAHAARPVRFDYTDQHGCPSVRDVEPHRQVLLGRHWYLLGFDRDAADWRTFRVDRIGELVVSDTALTPRPLPADPVSFVQDLTRLPPTGRRGVVRFAAPVAQVAERLTAEAGVLEAIDDVSCRYWTGADSWSWLALSLAAVGVPYTVEGPAELVEHTRAVARRTAAAVAASPTQALAVGSRP